MDIDIITIFPDMVSGFFRESMMKRAETLGFARFGFIDPRDFTHDIHRTVDDRPFGGGPGMVMKAEPLFLAVESIRRPSSRVILMTPQGRRFNRIVAREWSDEEHLIFVCGHYEGIDERVREALVTDEISIGDYILTNGALASAVVADAVVRLIPGVLGAGAHAAVEESFTNDRLEFPQYTRPAEFRGMCVPAILRSGNHGEIEKWREAQSLQRTEQRRPDLLD